MLTMSEWFLSYQQTRGNVYHWIWVAGDALVILLFVAVFYMKEWRIQGLTNRHKDDTGFKKGGCNNKTAACNYHMHTLCSCCCRLFSDLSIARKDFYYLWMSRLSAVYWPFLSVKYFLGQQVKKKLCLSITFSKHNTFLERYIYI